MSASNWLEPDPDAADVTTRVRRALARMHRVEVEPGELSGDRVPDLDSPEMERFVLALAEVLEEEHGPQIDDDPPVEEVRRAFWLSARDDTPAMLGDTIRGLLPPEDLACEQDGKTSTVSSPREREPRPDRSEARRTEPRQVSTLGMADDELLRELALRLHRKGNSPFAGGGRPVTHASFATASLERFLVSAYEALPQPTLSYRIKRLTRGLFSTTVGPELAIIDRDSSDPPKGRVQLKTDREQWDLTYYQEGNTLVVVILKPTAPYKSIRAVASGSDTRRFCQDMLRAFSQDPLSAKDAILSLREAIAGVSGKPESVAYP